MRALIQRVTQAEVAVAGDVIGRIGPGILVLVCAMRGDTEANAHAMAAKIAKLRIFQDENGKMNRALTQTGGAALVVSQFTLAADLKSGNRPGFSAAATPDEGEALYLAFAEALAGLGVPIETGRFGTDMAVSLTNDGPVTIWLEL
ncbi:MAG: D-aminoacyl-tRNA deacylase [Pseudomonadota bacterium]